MATPTRTEKSRTPTALVADLCLVLGFTILGRRSHAEGLTVTGIAETAWPFLTGTLTGWLLARGWRAPTAVVPTGVVVWLSTVVVGMALRKATSAGTATAFVVVATLTTGVLLIGWRAIWAAIARRRTGSA